MDSVEGGAEKLLSTFLRELGLGLARLILGIGAKKWSSALVIEENKCAN